MSIQAYPLQWPPNWPRADVYSQSNFGAYTIDFMRREINRELKLLKADDVVISSNLRLRKDGYPYSDQRIPDDPGIAVYFTLNGEDQCIPCDKWHRPEDNMRAIVKTVEALRGIERWGAKEMVNAAFRGFKALPESIEMGPGMARAWHEVLQVSSDASHAVIRSAYRSLALMYHPDNMRSGSAAKFAELQKAYKESGADG